ncbi:YjbQ family protein [Lacticaseibacillus paracasei]|uniref:YjbQ family protein n=1 Tax=Lacticaseibacillus paracasei TaxID=1597 RepID=UPI000AECBF31|nr:YjbQ family protein [Lacticaseibacillus paracasei]URW91243.1 YjbQ family protein [Lacticaseibacillus paracasei]
MLEKHTIQTKFNQLFPIHEIVKADVEKAQVTEGVCIVFCPHSTAGLTITSKMDLLGHDDIQDEYAKTNSYQN